MFIISYEFVLIKKNISKINKQQQKNKINSVKPGYRYKIHKCLFTSSRITVLLVNRLKPYFFYDF